MEADAGGAVVTLAHGRLEPSELEEAGRTVPGASEGCRF